MSKEYKMEYDLAVNFDKEVINTVSKVDKKGQIKTVFGKMRKDVLGGGRSSMTLPDLSFKELEEYIDLCHKNNLEFNYLINAACLGNKEVNPKYHKKIVKYIDKLCEAKVDAITVNSPFLCQLIKKQFPNLYVTIGVAANVSNCKHIKYWEELGADEITLPHQTNRNFELLQEILEFTKPRKIRSRVIANNICLHECPYKYSHSASQAHASQKGSRSSNVHVDYHLLSCNNKKMKNPTHIISSEWIRPEDIHYYEELCKKVGNYNFRIKLLDRTRTTDFLNRVIKAYINESYDGNLLDIVCWLSLKETKKINMLPMIAGILMNGYNINYMKEYSEIFKLPEVYVDNKQLDGFLDRFVNGHMCSNMTCSSNYCNAYETDNICNYCKEWADKVIKYDSKEVDAWIERSDKLLKSLQGSEFFK